MYDHVFFNSGHGIKIIQTFGRDKHNPQQLRNHVTNLNKYHMSCINTLFLFVFTYYIPLTSLHNIFVHICM